MWHWSLNWDEITPQIVVGSCPMTPSDLRRLVAEARVTAILSVQHDLCLDYWKIDYGALQNTATTLNVAMARCPIRDFDIPDMTRQLPRAVRALARLMSPGHRTYVHCTAGLGRSPLTVLAYLITVEGLPKADAWRMVLKSRPEAVPSPEALEGFLQAMATRYQKQVAQRAYAFFRQGRHSDAQRDWHEAEREILRVALSEMTD